MPIKTLMPWCPHPCKPCRHDATQHMKLRVVLVSHLIIPLNNYLARLFRDRKKQQHGLQIYDSPTAVQSAACQLYWCVQMFLSPNPKILWIKVSKMNSQEKPKGRELFKTFFICRSIVTLRPWCKQGPARMKHSRRLSVKTQMFSLKCRTKKPVINIETSKHSKFKSVCDLQTLYPVVSLPQCIPYAVSKMAVFTPCSCFEFVWGAGHHWAWEELLYIRTSTFLQILLNLQNSGGTIGLVS